LPCSILTSKVWSLYETQAESLPYIRADVVEEDVARYYGTIQLDPDSITAIGDRILMMMKGRTKLADQLARRSRTRILRLEGERKKLLQAHFAGAVPLDLLKEEQDRITQQLADAAGVLANTEVNTERMELNLRVALRLAADLEGAYRQAGSRPKRVFNQAIFEEVLVDVDGVTYARLADPFALLLADDLLKKLSRQFDNAKRSREDGPPANVLVGDTGLEPVTSAV
jgi:site-specific DNA recombinase